MDTSNRCPDGGYLAHLFPDAWFDDAPNLQSFLGVFDGATGVPTPVQFEGARLFLEAFKAGRTWATATGADLDELGGWLGVARVPGEPDTAYRPRIPATAQHGLSAATQPAMEALLTAAFGVPASASDGLTPGTATVTLYADVPLRRAVMPLVRTYKAAGMQVTGQILIPAAGATRGRAGTFRAGDAVAGGSGIYVPLP